MVDLYSRCLREEICKTVAIDHFVRHIYLFPSFPFFFPPPSKSHFQYLSQTLSLQIFSISYLSIFLSFFLSFFSCWSAFSRLLLIHSDEARQGNRSSRAGHRVSTHLSQTGKEKKRENFFYIQTYLCKMLSMDNRIFFL